MLQLNTLAQSLSHHLYMVNSIKNRMSKEFDNANGYFIFKMRYGHLIGKSNASTHTLEFGFSLTDKASIVYWKNISICFDDIILFYQITEAEYNYLTSILVEYESKKENAFIDLYSDVMEKHKKGRYIRSTKYSIFENKIIHWLNKYQDTTYSAYVIDFTVVNYKLPLRLFEQKLLNFQPLKNKNLIKITEEEYNAFVETINKYEKQKIEAIDNAIFEIGMKYKII